MTQDTNERIQSESVERLEILNTLRALALSRARVWFYIALASGLLTVGDLLFALVSSSLVWYSGLALASGIASAISVKKYREWNQVRQSAETNITLTYDILRTIS